MIQKPLIQPKKWSKQANLIVGQPTYFEKSINISRRQFKKEFPDTPVVHDLKKAVNYITKSKPHVYLGFYNKTAFKFEDNSYRDYLSQINHCIDFGNLDKVNIVNPTSIKFTLPEQEIPVEMMTKLRSMLGSPDKETFMLGWKILFNYNHETCSDKFIVLIGKANTISYYQRVRSREIEAKLSYLKQQYKNLKF